MWQGCAALVNTQGQQPLQLLRWQRSQACTVCPQGPQPATKGMTCMDVLRVDAFNLWA